MNARRLALASLLAALSLSAQTPPPTDVDGRPVKSDFGAPLSYSKPPAAQARSQAAPPATILPWQRQAALRRAHAKTSSANDAGALPFWQYAVGGSSIGQTGMEMGVVDGHPELYLTANSSGDFGETDFWYVLRKADGQTNYQQVFVHAPYEMPVRRLLLADVTGSAQPEILVALEDGTIEIYDQKSHVRLERVSTTNGLHSFAVMDLNGDGSKEFVVVTEQTLALFSRQGSPLWNLTDAGGVDVVVAQMDDDSGLEIATTAGVVVDASTRTVQWNYPSGFGRQLRAMDIDGDGRHELIAAEGWNWVYAYDVERRLPKWSLHTDQDIGAIELANVDSDPAPELLLGDGQWGSIHAYSTADQSEKWKIPNPEHGVTQIAVGDPDGDGALEVIWGAGASSTGPDFLFIHDVATGTAEWKSYHLGGPFVGPAVGDIDGDGRMELVTCSTDSDSGYGSGRIVVFDATNKTFRAISDEIGAGISWVGVGDLRLKDIDGDGAAEIIIGADRLYDGLIEIYGMSSDNRFTLKWTNASRPSGMPFHQVEVTDIDGDGDLEVVAANSVAHTGAEGTFVHVFDLNSGLRVNRSINMDTGWQGVSSMVIADLDGDGNLEVAALVSGSKIYIFDGTTMGVEHLLFGNFTAMAAIPPPGRGLRAGTDTGTVITYQFSGETEMASQPWPIAPGPITSLDYLGPELLWAASGGRGYVWSGASLVWRSGIQGPAFGRHALAFAGTDGLELFTTGQAELVAFRPQFSGGLATVELVAHGALTEGTASAASFEFIRSPVGTNAVDVRFVLAGTALAGTDYSVLGAQYDGSIWVTTIPAGKTNAHVQITALNNTQHEETRSIVAQLQPDENYTLGFSREAAVELIDDDPIDEGTVVWVESFDSLASEGRVNGRADMGAFQVTRYGSTDKPLAVRIAFHGSAIHGEDYRARIGIVLFRSGETEAMVTVTPIDDVVAEGDEDVVLEILPDPDYHLGGGPSTAMVIIQDNEPAVWIGGYSLPTTPNGTAATVEIVRLRAEAALVVHYMLTRKRASGAVEIFLGSERFPPTTTRLPISFPRGRRLQDQGEQISFEIISHPRYHLSEPKRVEFVVPADR
jgi:hypothetical protein